mgnify:CR=1 FL=1
MHDDGPGEPGDENGFGEGLVLPPEAYAVIFTEAEGYSIAMPDPNGGEVPAEAAALFAFLMRIQSEEGFLEEQLAWLEANQAGAGPDPGEA